MSASDHDWLGLLVVAVGVAGISGLFLLRSIAEGGAKWEAWTWGGVFAAASVLAALCFEQLAWGSA